MHKTLHFLLENQQKIPQTSLPLGAQPPGHPTPALCVNSHSWFHLLLNVSESKSIA